MRFTEGEIFEATFQSPAGPFRAAAEGRLDGDTLTLDGLAVYPETGDFTAAGVRQVLIALHQIEQWAKEDGFKRLVIVAKRLTGASPGRRVRLDRDLVK